ncbi:MAG: hypothetical protein RRY23_08695, partial [Alistipes sp.]
MNRIETYTVARHAFALQMDAASPLWECLAAYEPFRVKSVGEMGEIFTLTVANGEDETDLKALTSLGHFDSDGTCMELFITADDGRMFRIYSHDESAGQGSRL